MITDTDRINFLQAMCRGYGDGLICRDSTHGVGMRLHEATNANLEFMGLKYRCATTVRQAIDDAIQREAQSAPTAA